MKTNRKEEVQHERYYYTRAEQRTHPEVAAKSRAYDARIEIHHLHLLGEW